MPDRRESRFVLEALFLVALAVSVTVAQLRPIEIVGAMALGWLLAAGVEWAAWRGEPHYASGLPPRWYVPRVDLPPAQPLEAVVAGYPEGRRDEAPTWIASAALREELLGDWPLSQPIDDPAEHADAAVELPPEPEPVVDREQPSGELDAVLARATRRTARYSLEPLGEQPKRRFGRGGGEPAPTIEVPARPEGPRPLPGGSGAGR